MSKKRLLYLDNLKVCLTVLVIFHHAGQAYGDGGDWAYHPSNPAEFMPWLWAGVIVAIKIVNQLSALALYGRCCFPHTTANKWAGFLLFIALPMTFWSIIPITIVASVATFAAIHEGHFIRTMYLFRE